MSRVNADTPSCVFKTGQRSSFRSNRSLLPFFGCRTRTTRSRRETRFSVHRLRVCAFALLRFRQSLLEEPPMNPACLRCQGACCEEFSLPAGTARDDVSRWFALHGTSSLLPGGIPVLRFECTCTALSPSGLCSIYHARPDLCRTFEAGGAACLEVLERRRSSEQRARILLLLAPQQEL